MTTFVVRFMRGPTESFRGRVQHVSTGEEVVFSSSTELLAFFEGIKALQGFRHTGAAEEAGDSQADLLSGERKAGS